MANSHQASGSRSVIDELNALRERHVTSTAPNWSAMDELHNTLAQLEKRLSNSSEMNARERFSEPHASDRRIEDIAEIAEHLRRLNREKDVFGQYGERVSPAISRHSYNSREEQRSPAFDTGLLRQMDSRLDEISRAVIAANQRQQSDREEALRLERIEARLTELTQQLDNSVADQNADTLFRRLGELSQRIDALSEGSHLPDEAIEHLAQQINLLAHQVGRVMENLSQPDYHIIESRLEAIGQKLEAAEKWSAEPNPALLEKIDNKFRELTKRLDAQYASHYAESGLLHTLEGRLDDISQQISLSLLQTPPSSELALGESEAIRGLENQIANLARQLAKPSAEFAELKPRLDTIERSIADSRETFLDAAREAAETAIARVLKHGTQQDTTIALQLANDMKSLESLARSADERNSKTFEVVHETLVKVVDRLANLERQIDLRPSDSSIASKAKPVANPYSVAPNTAPKSVTPLVEQQKAPAVDAIGGGETLARLAPKTRREPVLGASLDFVQPDSDSVLDLNTIMKRVREERGQQDEEETKANKKADLISVARHAAQKAAEEASRLELDTDQNKDNKKSSLSALFGRQRKPILMAIGAVMLAIAGLQVGAAYLENNQQAEIAATDSTPEIDNNTTASIAPTNESKTTTDIQPMPQLSMPETQATEPQASDTPTEPQPELQSERNTFSNEAPAQKTEASLIEVPADAGPATLREAAESGDAHALFEIGNRYFEGVGVSKNDAEAAKWYALSAEKGFVPALYRLGNMNEKGLGMPRNIGKAIDWYQQSAQKGNAGAMHNLAVLYASGAGGSPDNAAAIRWFTDAAELGVKDSQYNLGILAAQGLGMPVDLEESYKWFALAAKAGDKDAADKRDQIGAALNPQQLQRAKDTVELWKAKPLNQEANSLDMPESWLEAKPVAQAPVDMKKAVRNIQLILQKNGYDVGTADGVMGNKTRNAISEIQKANGQEPTGEVNQQLVQLLLEKNK